MKFNKWTLGLAAVGAVSLASVASADEAKMSMVNTALSNTTLSGVVDIGYSQLLGDQRQNNGYYQNYYRNYGINTPYYGTGNYVDGFSLNQVIISLDKPLEADKAWSAGYHIDLNMGDAAVYYYDYIRQAYIALNTPVGNGINWKVGVMDGITGYEGNTLSANPNYTRSYGWDVNPATYVGVLGSYQIIDAVGITAGYINRISTSWDAQSPDAIRSSHSYVFAATFTAPQSLGFLAGSALNLQTVQGFDNRAVNNYSASLTLATPVAGLKFGFAFDAIQTLNNYNTPFTYYSGGGENQSINGNIYGIYATYQATDKLGFALRGEYVDGKDLGLFSQTRTYLGNNNYTHGGSNGEEVTATVSYNLWENVLTRVEFRWDHAEQGAASGLAFGANQSYANAFAIFGNVAYKF